ncbi:hypothetical protein LU683_28430 [Pseudomonas asiatica]|nr:MULTISPECIES: hypothetical protein [Pseudomonas]MCE0756810.1 hypothetical protein [Pseudomonas asiatica]
MPTENRSSNTDYPHLEAASSAMTQIRTMLGREQRPEQVALALEACDWSDTPIGNKAIVLSAIRALRTQQPHPEPIAWMVGTAIWWTKEEAERDAAATGLPMVGMGPMTDAGAVERLVAANTEYARRHLEHQGEVERLRSELAQCEAMAAMIADREWAEHVGTGSVSSKVESAFTQLHNDLHEAGEKLAERDALLRELADAPPAAMEFRLQQKVKAALSASAESQVKS